MNHSESKVADTADQARFDYGTFIAKHRGATVASYEGGRTVYAQGDAVDAVYYMIDGSVRVDIVSEHGKEGVIAFLGPGSFFGTDALHGHRQRVATVTANRTCDIVRIALDLVGRALIENASFAKTLLSYTLDENEHLREGLMDHLFNSSEKRLARLLLTLANAAPNEQSSVIPMHITQETLAHMVGTTRARINQFMRKFSKLGYVEYDGAIRVRRSLLNVILEDTHNGK